MKIVDKISKKYKTHNPFELAEFLGIIILYEDLGSINGYYNSAFRQKIIHINKQLDKHVQKFVAAHELGHALLHPKANTPFMKNSTKLSVDKMEIEANKFAMDLLISDDDLNEYKDFNIEQLSRIFGYNERLIQLRLK